MAMLDDLMEIIDELEVKDDFAYSFITNLKIRKENNPDRQMSGKEFKTLVDVHNRYYKGDSYA